MEFYTEAARKCPITDKTDVVVLGGGPAGVGAALAAAREGVKTILIEQSGDVGGVATSGLMSHWTGHTKGGLYAEILERTHHIYGANPKLSAEEMKIFIDHEYLKTVLLEMLMEAGVKIVLNTMACQPIMNGKRVQGVILENKSGRQVILSDIVIDCTGDGDIAARAGAEYLLGREDDHSMQPVTLMVQVGGVELEKIEYVNAFEETYAIPEGDIQTVARKYIAAPAGHALIYPSVFPGIVTLNMTNVTGVDGTSGAELSDAYICCRKQLAEIMAFLTEHVPGFAHSYLLKSAAQIGVRETRHFKGLYTLTEEDILSAKIFEDWAVTKAHFNFDVHNITGAGLDNTGCQQKFTQEKGYTIPYRCLVPAQVDGLLLAGRNISGTHMAHSNYRAMPICVNMGQAAGVAASLCAKQRLLPRDLPAKALQTRLRELGVTP